MIKVEEFSFPGRGKPNQDCLTHIDNNGVSLLAIADGMGGVPGGEIASALAIESCRKLFTDSDKLPIADYFRAACEAILCEAQLNSNLNAMGTTLTVCRVGRSRVDFGHVGDTRLYHLKDQEIITRSRDQTEVQHLLDAKVLTRVEALNYKRKNVLFSAVTKDPDFIIQEGSFDIQSRDRLILISDGAYSCISKTRIRDLSVQIDDLLKFKQSLIECIEMEAVNDDYSALIYEHQAMGS